jgi:LmbE family N-acetylglucosaminyl deacetylase
MAVDRTDRQVTVFAIVAHPDDVEFMMAGTLLLLRRRNEPPHLESM